MFYISFPCVSVCVTLSTHACVIIVYVLGSFFDDEIYGMEKKWTAAAVAKCQFLRIAYLVLPFGYTVLESEWERFYN